MSLASQRSLAGGEIAPSLYARTDTVKYATGVRTLRNFLIMRNGGAANRPGTSFVAEVKDSAKRVRLIPFVFNDDQTYVLEFGDEYMRVHRFGAQVVSSVKNVTGIVKGTETLFTVPAHGFASDGEIFLAGIGGMTQLNNKNFKISDLTTDTFKLRNLDGSHVDSSGLPDYTGGGTAAPIFEIDTPYQEEDLLDLHFVQSADVVTLANKNYAPRDLSRTGHAAWDLDTIVFEPLQAKPTGVAIGGTAGAISFTYHVTAVNSENFEESLAAVGTQGSLAAPTTAAPHTITWVAAPGAGEYNIYFVKNGVPGFIGTAIGTSFVNDNITPDLTDTPPAARNPFNGAANFPATVSYIQQRLVFANTDNNPEGVFTSRSGNFTNFTTRSPLQDDDAVTFSLAGRQVNEVRSIIELSAPVMFTSSGEWEIRGNAAGILTPGEVNPRQNTYNGSGFLQPIVIDSTALYVQARQSIIRDFKFDFENEGFRGDDLTIFASHLFDEFTIVDWAYQKIPHSIVWAVRDDGALIGMTYVREHEIFAWHRHDFDGFVENVCVVPEGNEDILYLVVRREIQGFTKRYIERMDTRLITDVRDMKFSECSLSFDGRNLDETLTMTLSGAGWTENDELTLTASDDFFLTTDEDFGNGIHLRDATGEIIRMTISSVTSPTVAKGYPNRTVPESLQNEAVSDWDLAVDELSGLNHLEGKSVSVFADGLVVASPNNPDYPDIVVQNGRITLPRNYGVVHVGLPYTCDIETLDIDSANAESNINKFIRVSEVHLTMEKTRGLFAGPKPPKSDLLDPLEELNERKYTNEEGYDSPPALFTGKDSIIIRPEWNSNGRVFIRQVDPLPVTILGIAADGQLPY